MNSDKDTAHDSDSWNESSEEDDGLSIALEPEPTTSKDKMEIEDYHYEVLSTEQIVQHMVDCIREVNVVVQIPPTITRILLNHFRWDKEKLYERYYDDDQDRLFIEAHVVNPSKIPPYRKLVKNRSRFLTPRLKECEICLKELPCTMMTGLACGHRFCTECWTEYLTNKIMDQGIVQTIACAAHECDILVDDEAVMKLIIDPKVKLKYQHLITNSFVECNRLLRLCPQPECNNAIKVQYNDSQPVTCSCGHTFCFSCGENWHDPVRCHLLKKWQKKCDDDGETSKWIAANTKDCPKCQVAIEKNGGCNHMICTNENCKVAFCWVCLGPWEIHGSLGYICNRYDVEECRAARAAQDISRAELQKYLFYCNRFMNHMQSLKFENDKLNAAVKEKMEEMQQYNISWIDVQFLVEAVDVLCQCRQSLMYTYAFAYYLRKNNQSAIFEDNQGDLESATEKLSEYLERDIAEENLCDIRQNVQDKYRYCESRRKVLLGHVHEGYENNWWEYTE